MTILTQNINIYNEYIYKYIYDINRNLAKALPWFTDVREKLLDPSYNDWWFLKFKEQGPYHVPACTNGTNGVNKCSKFYHDQEQTPHAPAQCTNGNCDCGGGKDNAEGITELSSIQNRHCSLHDI